MLAPVALQLVGLPPLSFRCHNTLKKLPLQASPTLGSRFRTVQSRSLGVLRLSWVDSEFAPQVPFQSTVAVDLAADPSWVAADQGCSEVVAVGCTVVGVVVQRTVVGVVVERTVFVGVVERNAVPGEHSVG